MTSDPDRRRLGLPPPVGGTIELQLDNGLAVAAAGAASLGTSGVDGAAGSMTGLPVELARTVKVAFTSNESEAPQSSPSLP